MFSQVSVILFKGHGQCISWAISPFLIPGPMYFRGGSRVSRGYSIQQIGCPEGRASRGRVLEGRVWGRVSG